MSVPPGCFPNNRLRHSPFLISAARPPISQRASGTAECSRQIGSENAQWKSLRGCKAFLCPARLRFPAGELPRCGEGRSDSEFCNHCACCQNFLVTGDAASKHRGAGALMSCEWTMTVLASLLSVSPTRTACAADVDATSTAASMNEGLSNGPVAGHPGRQLQWL